MLAELRKRLAARSKSADSETPKLELEAKKLKAEVARLVNAVAVSAENPAAVMKAISDREARLSVIRGHIEAAKAAPKVLDLEVKAMEVEASKRLGDLQGLLSRNPDDARKALNAILAQPLKVTPVVLPEGKRFRIEGELALGTIFALDTGTSSGVLPTVSPAGSGQKDAASGVLPTMSPTGSRRSDKGTVRELFKQAATERPLVPKLDLVA